MAAGGEMVAAGLEQPEEKLAKKKIRKATLFFPLVQLLQLVSLVWQRGGRV